MLQSKNKELHELQETKDNVNAKMDVMQKHTCEYEQHVTKLQQEIKDIEETKLHLSTENEKMKKQASKHSQNIGKMKYEDQQKQCIIDNLKNERDVITTTFGLSLDEIAVNKKTTATKHDTEYNDDKRCAEAWKERNAILTGELKALWTAYDKLVKSSSCC